MDGPIIFDSARFVVQNVAASLPQHATRRYGRRDPKNIQRIVLHHTAGQILAPPRGLLATVGYCVRAKPDGRNWPGMPYHVYIPHSPLLHEGKPIVYQCQGWGVASWHTGGANATGVGVCFQGSFASVAGQRDPSPAQQALVGPVVHEWLLPTLGLGVEALRGHMDYTKPSCPGWWLERWVRAARKGEQWPPVEVG